MENKKLIFDWFMKEIKKGISTDKAFQILEILITKFLDENKLFIIERDYIETEVINILWKLGNAEKITFSYISHIARRLKRNLLRNNKAFYFWELHTQYHEQLEVIQFYFPETNRKRNKQKTKTYLKLKILKKVQIFYFGCLKKKKRRIK